MSNISSELVGSDSPRSELASTRLSILRLGAKGEGVAEIKGEIVGVPYALPGEEVSAYRDGKLFRLLSVETASPARQAPMCPYFTRCGGCATQHMDEASYRDWKLGLVASALKRAGLNIPIAGMIDAHGEGRRRATFHLRDIGGRLTAGFMMAGTHDLVPIEHCPITVPALAAAPRVAELVCASLNWRDKPLDALVTATENGLDIDLRGHGPLNEKQRLRLGEAAKSLDLARLAVHGDVVVERRPPIVRLDGIAVSPPAGGFLQATELGEATLGRLVTEACRGSKRVADLFAGSGAFALRLAAQAEVHAVESLGAALVALDKAARASAGAERRMRRITTETRDLFRRPLLKIELDAYDAVVMDPPRAGAEAQARQLASSRIRRVVMVSCDAATFARDAAILIAGGFQAAPIHVVDQFRYAGHVELVGAFTRTATKGARR